MNQIIQQRQDQNNSDLQIQEHHFLKKYVHITTPEVYGSTDSRWINENHNFSPSTPYAVSRAACDMHLKSFYEAYNFPVVFTRAANVFGPGQLGSDSSLLSSVRNSRKRIESEPN